MKKVYDIVSSLKKDLYDYNASVVELRDAALLVLQSDRKDGKEKILLNKRLEKAIENIGAIIGDNGAIEHTR